MTDLIRISEFALPGQGDATFRIAKQTSGAAYSLEMPRLSRSRAEQVCGALDNMQMPCVTAPDLPG